MAVRPFVLAGVAAATLTLTACGSVPTSAPTPEPTSGPNSASSPSATASPSASGSTPLPPSSAAPSSTPSGASTTQAPPAQPSCASVAAALSPTQQAGQLLMVGVSSFGASSEVRRVLARTHAGSIVLLGNTTAGADTVRAVARRAANAADAPKGTNTLIAADQEGGQVQRLRGPGFSRMPSAIAQADDSDSRLRTEARQWGEQLVEAGVHANLAPVADVVPESLRRINQPIGQLDRGYGSDPQRVADKVTAFNAGMQSAELATAVKHFPGLGRVRGNTDFVSRVVDDTTTRHDAYLAGFTAAAKAGVDMIMVSSATYAKIDNDHRAAFSTTVIGGMIRTDLGYRGVVISDDLSAAAMRDLTPGRRALSFLRAGGDLAIVGNPAQAEAMSTAIVAEAEDDSAFAAQVRASVTRVLTMKARHGLASCS